jgi:hypothetical protein
VNSNYGAAICENGDLVSFSVEVGSKIDKHCALCGALVHSQCPKCNQKIRGGSKVHTGGFQGVPRFCPGCGAPYPWTAAMRRLFDEELDLRRTLDQLTEDEKIQLTRLADDAQAGNLTSNRLELTLKMFDRLGKSEVARALIGLLKGVTTDACAQIIVHALGVN